MLPPCVSSSPDLGVDKPLSLLLKRSFFPLISWPHVRVALPSALALSAPGTVSTVSYRFRSPGLVSPSGLTAWPMPLPNPKRQSKEDIQDRDKARQHICTNLSSTVWPVPLACLPSFSYKHCYPSGARVGCIIPGLEYICMIAILCVTLLGSF